MFVRWDNLRIETDDEHRLLAVEAAGQLLHQPRLDDLGLLLGVPVGERVGVCGYGGCGEGERRDRGGDQLGGHLSWDRTPMPEALAFRA